MDPYPIHDYADEVAVEYAGGDFYEVYIDPGYFAEVTTAAEITRAINNDVDVYNRRTGELVEDVSQL